MGTKIQANAFFREYHSVIDLDGSTSNGMRYSGPFKSYGSEKVRQTILEHESVFRHQLQELHRLYRRQQELMNEIKRIQTNNMEKPQLSKSSIFPNGNKNHRASYDGDAKLSLGTLDLYSKRTDYRGDLRITNPSDGIRDGLTLSRGHEVSTNSRSNSFNPVTRDFFQSSMDGMDGASSLCSSNDYADGRRFDKHSSVGGLCPSKPVAFPPSLLAEPRSEFWNRPLDIGTSVSQGRKKIFGVEISDGNENRFNTASSKMSSTSNQKVRPQHGNHRVVSFEPSSWIANSLELVGANDGKNVIKGPHVQCAESEPIKYFKNLEDINSKPGDILKKNKNSRNEVPNGGLPWFLRNSKASGDQSKPKASSYFMNLDSLQNCSQDFFKKAEIAEGVFQASKQKKELSLPISDQNAEHGTNEVINGTGAKGFPISGILSFKNRNSEDNLSKLETDNLVSRKGSNNHVADLRHHIDLNLSLDEDDAPSAPSIPTAIVKIATTEIDLEAPAVIASETDGSHHSEVDTSKMDVSLGNREVSYEECDKMAAEAIIAISLSNEAESGNSLEWFAEIVSSQEESVPDGMDYFEFMTLKLEDTKEELYHDEPFLFNNPSDDDDETKATSSKRCRRGQSRRGRQRKDFQRDVLPGLVTLSRLEVTEDFQTFEELLKGEGATWQLKSSQRSSMRNGRGRKRLGCPSNTSPTMKAVCSRTEQPVCQLEERSLTGWGKRTRRLPRQRCPNAILSLPVKC